MATIDQAPSLNPQVNPDQDSQSEGFGPLNYLLARAYAINWETIFYIGLFVVAVLSRFVNLGDRVMSHDESLHTNYSFGLYNTGRFEHTPLMHGPLLFHMTALMYFLFGASDFSARLYPAILGVILIFLPRLLFSRWLGKFGSAIASVGLLISPMVLFHNRYIREDTPSIFFTVLMIYAIFAYLDGVKPRQFRWLILLCAGMVLSLASKEVAFMYVGIFGLIITIYWLLQVVQGIRRGTTAPVVGWILGGVIGLGLLVGISVALGSATSHVLEGQITLSPAILTVIFFVVLGLASVILFRVIRASLGEVGDNARSIFQLVITGLILGTVGALGMTCILSIIGASSGMPPEFVRSLEVRWIVGLGAVLLIALIGTALFRFAGSPWFATALLLVLTGLALVAVADLTLVMRLVLLIALVVAGGLLTLLMRGQSPFRLPWGDILLVVLVAFVTCVALTVFEERSRNVVNTDTTTQAIQNIWIYGTWVIGALVIAGILLLRFATPFFQEMKRFPAFDILILMGTLILPWLAAIPVFLAHYQLGDNTITGDTLVYSAIASVPFWAVAIVAGLCWNPKAWIICAATFYAIFAFFYTTMFTNANGIGTGLIGSLGYWLSQQGVRRGSQPQYYYLFVELPVYEYLPVIGAMCAGVLGLLGLWRFRRARIEGDPLSDDGSDTSAMSDNPPLLESSESGSNSILGSLRQLRFPGDRGGNEAVSSDVWTPDESAQSTAALERATPTAYRESLDALPGADTTMPSVAEGQVLDQAVSEDTEEFVTAPRAPINEAETLGRLPFMAFVGFWGVFLLMAFTVAGEKMPWLTTHLTIPFIFATGWYLGKLLEGLKWPAFFKQGWTLILLTPILGIALANVAGPFLFGNVLIGSQDRNDLLSTFTWLGAILLAGLIAYGMYRIWRRIGFQQAVRTILIGAFVLLAVLTARTAWMAAFINYDSAKEFLVYAHGAPADKIMMTQLADLSQRTTDGLNIKVAYDADISWPGTWYFRDYPNATYLGDSPNVNDLDKYTAVVIGSKNNAKVEPVMQDKFYEFKYIRLWWPMQDYFNLNANQIDNVFAGDDSVPDGGVSPAKLRQGLWQIWWNRDYTAYGDATNKKFDVANWPVSDWMYFYVRKDAAAQIWDFGTGSTKVAGLPTDPFSALVCTNCAPNLTFGDNGTDPGKMNHPRDLTVGPNGNLYVADSLNTRISQYDVNGQPVSSFGTASTGDSGGADGTFREPWGVAVAKDGTVYVADTWNHRVEVFDKDGKFLRKWGQFEQVSTGTGLPDGLWGPRAITLDNNGHVFVADTGNKRIRVFSTDGTFMYDIGRDPAGIQLNEPVGLAVDGTRNELYIADTWDKKVEVVSLSEQGKEVRSFPLQAWGGTTESSNRPYLALDKTGKILFVTDPDTSRILVMDAVSGKPISSFTTPGNTLGGIVVDGAGQLFVADAGGGKIERYDIASISGLAAPDQAPALPATQDATQATKDSF
jgi:predicted membrane-bound mannosyltransferase